MAKKSKCKKNVGDTIMIIISLILIVGIISFFIYTQITEFYAMNEPKILEIKEKLRKVHPRVDSLDFFAGNKSYTINKQKVYLCLKDENGKYYEMNMLIYVALHELAHVLCDEIGHTDKFKRIFEDLLIDAENKGIYNPNTPPILDYCNYN
jgi:hypothetical protein